MPCERICVCDKTPRPGKREDVKRRLEVFGFCECSCCLGFLRDRLVHELSGQKAKVGIREITGTTITMRAQDWPWPTRLPANRVN